MRRATKPGHSFHVGIGHFYPRSPCGERPVVYGAGFAHGEISIHALLAESDQGLPHLDIRALDFYPRSPCGERRRKQQVHELWLGFLSTLSLRRATICGRSATTCARFLSTLSLRRATGAALWRADRLADFYPRSPCGERHLRVLDGSKSSIISIHALLAESDSFAPKPKTKATISIHALLAESDVSMRIDMGNNIDFYPRSPCGERRRGCWAMLSPWPISIHALLAESDKLTARQSGRLLDFYPRSPCGERQYLVRGQRPSWGISIHALLAESDVTSEVSERVPLAISIHALLAESDLISCLSTFRPVLISIHALLAESDAKCHCWVLSDINFYPRSPCGERRLFYVI